MAREQRNIFKNPVLKNKNYTRKQRSPSEIAKLKQIRAHKN